ncbi:MAG: 4Fe-4S binding protein [bacterium]
MAYFINDDCVMCGSCKDECPNAAISEGDPKYIIDPNKCDDCGTCAEVCPVGAPQPQK